MRKTAVFLSFLFSTTIFSQNRQVPYTSVELATAISHSRMVENVIVGYRGQFSEIYDMALQLEKISPDSLLHRYCSDTSRVLSTYAFIGLLKKRNPELIISALKQHENDTTPMLAKTGCLVYTTPLIDFWLIHTRYYRVTGRHFLGKENHRYFRELYQKRKKIFGKDRKRKLPQI